MVFGAAGHPERDLLVDGAAVLGGDADFDARPASAAEGAGVGEIAARAAEELKVEMADLGVGDDRDGGPQAPALDRFGFGLRNDLTWPPRMKARWGRPPGR